jgi:hypothetical protein
MLRARPLRELLQRCLLEGNAAALPQLGQMSFAKAAAKPASKGSKNNAKMKSKPKKKGPSKTSIPMNEKDPVLMRVVGMFEHKPTKHVVEAEEQRAATVAIAKDYSRRKLAQHVAWQKDMKLKIGLKQRALAALPAELRAEAEKEDLAPFPTVRSYLYESPPNAYRS